MITESLRTHTHTRHVLHSELAQWLQMPALSLSHKTVHLYMQGIQRWLADKDIPVLPGSAVASAKRPGIQQNTMQSYFAQLIDKDPTVGAALALTMASPNTEPSEQEEEEWEPADAQTIQEFLDHV